MNDLSVVPHGAWPSPITADLVATGGVSLGQVEIHAGTVYWIEGRPAEAGRSVLARRAPGADAEDVTPALFDARRSRIGLRIGHRNGNIDDFDVIIGTALVGHWGATGQQNGREQAQEPRKYKDQFFNRNTSIGWLFVLIQ